MHKRMFYHYRGSVYRTLESTFRFYLVSAKYLAIFGWIFLGILINNVTETFKIRNTSLDGCHMTCGHVEFWPDSEPYYPTGKIIEVTKTNMPKPKVDKKANRRIPK